MNNEEAKEFLMKGSSYCNFKLPYYIEFDTMLNELSTAIGNKSIKNIKRGNPSDFDDVNYKMLSNKNGRYSWRPYELINPVFYVCLVNEITKKENWSKIVTRFSEFKNNKNIKCISLPVESKTSETDTAEQITNWWEDVEQKSLELFLDYDYIAHVDIENCYGSIYTHTISWSIHGKSNAKRDKNNKKLLGNIIDSHIMWMSNGQTNSIPQGSTLMDFIAEIVLGYGDEELSKKLDKELDKDTKYKIIRYRDDYRIFSNNSSDIDVILKCLTEVLIDLGLKFNTSKTLISDDIIKSSLKNDKWEFITNKNIEGWLQKNLLLIYDFSIKFPNSGSLNKMLRLFRLKIKKTKSYNNINIEVLLSILVKIMINNPKVYNLVSSIIADLITNLEEDIKTEVFNKILVKFISIPNVSHVNIWLQRIAIPNQIDVNFKDIICDVVDGTKKCDDLWNFSWINNKCINRLFNSRIIINEEKLKNTPVAFLNEESVIFEY